jgi:hypothetical protein
MSLAYVDDDASILMVRPRMSLLVILWCLFSLTSVAVGTLAREDIIDIARRIPTAVPWILIAVPLNIWLLMSDAPRYVRHTGWYAAYTFGVLSVLGVSVLQSTYRNR